jgi:hypothetical protein
MPRTKTRITTAELETEGQLATVFLVTRGAEKLVRIKVHEWTGLRARPGGAIRVEGTNGEYVVTVIDEGLPTPGELKFVGGMEACLKYAFKLATKYRENGLK